jgi:hypothetical protein
VKKLTKADRRQKLFESRRGQDATVINGDNTNIAGLKKSAG